MLALLKTCDTIDVVLGRVKASCFNALNYFEELRKMKKGLKKTAAVFAAVCMIGMTACGSGSSSAKETQAASAGSTEAASEAVSEAASEGQAEEGTVYHVGICQLVQHDALDRATKGFQDALTEKLGDQVVFDVQNAQGDSQNCATIANQFVSSNYDLILANATAALQACSNATSEIPVIGTSITSFPSALDIELNPDGSSGINVTGTNDLAPLDQQAQMIADLFPEVKQVGILYCSAEVNSVYQAEHIAEYLDGLNITHKDFSFSDSNDLQAVVQTAVSECDVLYTPTDNTVASNTGLIDSVARPAGVPIIAGEESQCIEAGLASLSIDFYDIGYRAGEMAYEILANGADPATMPIEDPNPESLTKVYNAKIAEDLGITLGDDYQPLELE